MEFEDDAADFSDASLYADLGAGPSSTDIPSPAVLAAAVPVPADADQAKQREYCQALAAVLRDQRAAEAAADGPADLSTSSSTDFGEELLVPPGDTADEGDDGDDGDDGDVGLLERKLQAFYVNQDLEAKRRKPYDLPEELWRKIFVHASPGRIFDVSLTNNIEEQEGSLCGLGFWRISYVSQWTRYQLCLVSRRFNMIATPLLYRDLRLTTEKAILHFARTLALPSLPPALRAAATHDQAHWRDLRLYPLRLDVDLAPYLNLKDEDGNPIMELDENDEERQVDYTSEATVGHPIRVLAHLILHLPNLKLFLFDSTENLHSMPPILLTALARARCAKGLVDLDWFPVSKFNVVAFFELMTTATNLQHLEIGEMQDEFWISRHPQISLPHLHTLAISGDGASTCAVFAKANLPALRRLTHWSNVGPVAISTLELLCQAHGKNLEVLALWSPGGRLVVAQDSFDQLIKQVLLCCPRLRILELDMFAPHPLPADLAPHPSVVSISLGLECHPLKEREDPDHPFVDVSPMSELVLSVSRRAFPKLESVHLLSADMTAMFLGAKDVWADVPAWCAHARREKFVLRDGWGDAIREEDWWWLDGSVASQLGRSPPHDSPARTAALS